MKNTNSNTSQSQLTTTDEVLLLSHFIKGTNNLFNRDLEKNSTTSNTTIL